ncbi:FHA domain-containing protein [Mycobacterium sp. ENV421]|uniref:FHA domain-containing protein n=1 Tax=Mycobacterium sp. ENV421 TaxID=1213407 RepID=UPI001E567F34|nr:FHA domain-containing protein [Mycobacterium sp. ENV421]
MDAVTRRRFWMMGVRLVDHTPTLIVRVGAQTRVVNPADGPIVLGRDSGAAIYVPDEGISRRHVRLEPHPGGWLAVDTSTNGIYVSGRRRSSVPIADGLRLHLGHPTEGIVVVFEHARDGHTELAPVTAGPVRVADPAAQVPAAPAAADDEDLNEDLSGDIDPAIAHVGAAVAARRAELDLTQRGLARDGIVAGATLIALEKGRRWPRDATLGKLEGALGWGSGTLNQLREDAAAALSDAVPAATLADVIDLALATLSARIGDLPEPSSPDYTPRATSILTELHKLEITTAGAARNARGSAALAVALGAVRARYNDLMLAAAQAPNATVGQRLYAARRALGLSAEEAANAAGIATVELLAAEAGEHLGTRPTAALEALLDQLAPAVPTA